jgi:hypothetical protein
MSKFRFTVTLAFFISFLVQSCKDNTVEQGIAQKKEVEVQVGQSNIDKINLDYIIDNYIKQLSNSDIKIVDSITCAQMELNRENYDKGIITYGYYSIKSNLLNGKIAGDLNGDKQTDYIANYSCENCYGGIGSGNYLSNCFFLTSKDNELIVNEEMTNDFKKKLIDTIKKDFGEEYIGVKPEKEKMINGIEFTEIKNQIAYGTFNINTDACEGSPFPCVKGTFEYDTSNKTLKMSGKITVEQ